MKKILLALIALLAAVAPARAQVIHGFVSSGLTLSQIEGDGLKGFKHFGYTGGVGALAPISANGRWGASIEALFSQRGARGATILSDRYLGTIALNYVDIPLMIHFQDIYGGMLVGAGLMYGRLVQQPHGELRYQELDFIPDTSDMNFLRNDLSVVADARFTVWRGLQLNLRWQYSLLAIKRQWHFTRYVNNIPQTYANDCYNHAITLRLIYQF